MAENVNGEWAILKKCAKIFVSGRLCTLTGCKDKYIGQNNRKIATQS